MGTAGAGLIHGLDPTEIADDLDRLYCYEQVAIHVVRAIENRLTGIASIVLADELLEQIALAERHASRLAPRIAELGGAITQDPTLFVERAQLPQVEVPTDNGDVREVLTYALAQEQRAIARYGQLIDRVRGLDVVTERLLVSILSGKVAREDEIEGALAESGPGGGGASWCPAGRGWGMGPNWRAVTRPRGCLSRTLSGLGLCLLTVSSPIQNSPAIARFGLPGG